MNSYSFHLQGADLQACGSGALFWPAARLLVVSDLHLGKPDRIARLGGTLLPPYANQDTLLRLEAEIDRTRAATVVCLGDSFDDMRAAEELPDAEMLWLTRMMAGRRWFWIAGNHDPAPSLLGGSGLSELRHLGLVFRHIAVPGDTAEVSGHYHPKARLSAGGSGQTRRCFLLDRDRVILPAFGTYAGGLHSDVPVLSGLMRTEALAVLIGPAVLTIPMPRDQRRPLALTSSR